MVCNSTSNCGRFQWCSEVTLGDVFIMCLLMVLAFFIVILITEKFHRLVRSVVRQELSRFLYDRPMEEETRCWNKPLSKNVKSNSNTGSVCSVLRTLTNGPGIHAPGGPECQGYNRMDLDEGSSFFSTCNSYDAKSLTV